MPEIITLELSTPSQDTYGFEYENEIDKRNERISYYHPAVLKIWKIEDVPDVKRLPLQDGKREYTPDGKQVFILIDPEYYSKLARKMASEYRKACEKINHFKKEVATERNAWWDTCKNNWLHIHRKETLESLTASKELPYYLYETLAVCQLDHFQNQVDALKKYYRLIGERLGRRDTDIRQDNL